MKFIHLTEPGDISALITWHNLFSPYVVLDTETTSKDPRIARLVDIQMTGMRPGEVVLFSGEHLQRLKALETRQVWWNFRFDWKVCLRHGLDFRADAVMHDGMLLHHLLDENAPHDMDSIVTARWGDDYKAIFWGKYKAYLDAPFEERMEYACKDIHYTDLVYQEILAGLKAQGIPESLWDQSHRLARALLDTEIDGIRVDQDYLMARGTELQTDIAIAERELRALGGYHCEAVELRSWAKSIEKTWTPRGKKWQTLPKPEFSFASPQQVAALLYEELGLPVQIDPKTKNPTANDAALEELGDLHPLIPRLRDLRKYSKMQGSFIEGVLERQVEGRIHPSFNINGTKTGRISHSDPNMGQMPSKGEWSKIRGIFVPEPGNVLLTADYGQLEVCIAAHFSQDANLLKIIHEGASQHDITAEGLGIPRGQAKTLNFAMQYLCSPYKVVDLLGCSQKDAVRVWSKYWQTYAGLKAFIDRCIADLDRGLPARSPFGRLRRFPGFVRPKWSDPSQGKFASEDRQYFNALIQGTGGDMMSRAFYRTHETLKERGWGRGWFTVHDEGLIEVRAEYAEPARALLVENMLALGPEIKLSVPLKVEASEPLLRWSK